MASTVAGPQRRGEFGWGSYRGLRGRGGDQGRTAGDGRLPGLVGHVPDTRKGDPAPDSPAGADRRRGPQPDKEQQDDVGRAGNLGRVGDEQGGQLDVPTDTHDGGVQRDHRDVERRRSIDPALSIRRRRVPTTVVDCNGRAPGDQCAANGHCVATGYGDGVSDLHAARHPQWRAAGPPPPRCG